MKSENIQILQSQFDSLTQQISREEVEFWFAPHFQEPLCYAWWNYLQIPIKRVIKSGETTGYDTNNLFYNIIIKVRLGRESKHAIPNKRSN